MRLAFVSLAALLLVALAGCETMQQVEKKDPFSKTVIDEAKLEDLLLTAGDPNESVTYFQRALAKEPNRADFRRGLAVSLSRARRYPEAARVFEEMMALDQAEPTDKLEYAVVAARLERWDDVKSAVDALPAGLNTARRYLVEAMLSDHDTNWQASDTAYAKAESLSANPAPVLNNWGVSMMSREDFPGAIAKFQRALSYDSRLFNAKNNMAIARGLQGNYQLPPVPMTETEKAYILNNLGLIALRKGDKDVARGLFAAAVAAHPQHYAAAASRLAALESTVVK